MSRNMNLFILIAT